MGEDCHMRRFLLTSALAVQLIPIGAARAVLPVEDAASEASLVQQVATAGKQLAQLQQQYEQLVATYNQVTAQFHMLTQFANPNGLAQELERPFMQNPLPSVGSLPGMFTGGGGANAYAQQFLGANRIYAPPDYASGKLMSTQTSALAAIEGTVTANLQSLEQRITGLTDLQSQLNNATTIQQVSSINARINAEQNYEAAQQAQATNLQTLAMVQIAAQQQAQHQLTQQQAAEAAQQFPVSIP